MKLQVYDLSLPSPGGELVNGCGWSDVFVHFQDVETEIMPSVTIRIHVPISPSDTYKDVRELTLARARELVKAASLLLDQTDVSGFDKKDRSF